MHMVHKCTSAKVTKEILGTAAKAWLIKAHLLTNDITISLWLAQAPSMTSYPKYTKY